MPHKKSVHFFEIFCYSICMRRRSSLALMLTSQKIRCLITDSPLYRDLLCANSNLSLSPLTLDTNLPKHSDTRPCAGGQRSSTIKCQNRVVQ